MTPERFEHLLSMVGPRIKKKDTRMREAIGPAERLTLTLQYSASGNDQQSLSFSYRVGEATVSNIIHETLTAKWSVLKDRYLGHQKSKQIGYVFLVKLKLYGISLTAWELLMASTLPCNVLEKVAPCIMTAKGSSALCSWLSAMEITIILWLILGSMAVTMTVVFLAIQKWGKHLKMAPSISQLQYIFQVVTSYLHSLTSLLEMRYSP